MEQYGVKPKRFTKAWWPYFWEYYKIHTIATAFVLVMTVVSIVQCANQTTYDHTLTLAGNVQLPEDREQPLTDKIKEAVMDVNGDGEINVYLQQLITTGNPQNAEYEAAALTKLELEYAVGDGYLYIYSKNMVDDYLNGIDYEMFQPVSDWAEVMPTEDRLALKNGTAYAVRLSDSRVLSELGIDFDNYYLAMRIQRNNEKDKELPSLWLQNAKSVANLLIGE